MKNKIIFVVVGLLVIVGIGVAMQKFGGQKITPPVTSDGGATSPKDATYTIEGQAVTLTDGSSAVLTGPNSTTKVTTQYFGDAVTHDFDGDGRPDTAFILTQNSGGSGTFYYVVAALNTANGYVGSQGFFLGDRIAPQTVEMSQDPRTPNVIVVNYADRKPTDSFTTPPSVGKSVWLLLDPKTMQFGEVAQNFSGEADPSKMTLGMKTWTWVDTAYNNDTTVTPKVSGKFTITFQSSTHASVSTDCNSVGEDYAVSGNKITFTKGMSTNMSCTGSQEGNFLSALSQVRSYLFTSKGELVLELGLDSGSMIFR